MKKSPRRRQLREAALQAEMATHLKAEEPANRRNGSCRKTIKSTSGRFDLATPRDSSGTFEPQLVKNTRPSLAETFHIACRQCMSNKIKRKIISMLRRLAEHVFIPEKQAGDVSRGTSLKSTAARQAIAR